MKTARLSGLSKLTMAGLVAVGLATLGILWMQATFVLVGLVFAATWLVLATLVATRIAWMPALAGLVAAAFFWFAWRPALVEASAHLSEPTHILLFVTVVIQAVGSAIAALAGIGATIKRP